MNVLAYYNQYRQMKVRLVAGGYVYGIDVHEYRNATDYFNPKKDVISADFDINDGMRALSQLKRSIAQNGKKLGTGRYSLTFNWIAPAAPLFDPLVDFLGRPRALSPKVSEAGTSMMTRFASEIVDFAKLTPPFHGKGTPSEIQTVLRLVVALGLVSPSTDAMNAYVSRNIGLDCSGFVGNYLFEKGLMPTGRETKSTDFAPSGKRINSLDSIRAESVLVWTGTNHVAIVNEVEQTCYPDGCVHAMVAESTGARLVPGDIHTDGLNYTKYIFKSADAKNGIFKVQRGIGGSKIHTVYVANYS